MKTKLLIISLLAATFISACSEMKSHPMDMTEAVQNATTKADHEALAQHYEEIAKEMQVKVEEHKKLLGQYQAKSHVYGKQAESFKEHCQTLINFYQKAAEENLQMAALHRQM